MNDSQASAFDLYELDWDTRFFGITCAKAILYKPLASSEWEELQNQCADYQFVCLENRNSDPVNARFIGKQSNAYLADVNIQFAKEPNPQGYTTAHNIQIKSAFQKNEHILQMAQFGFSRFVEDPELLKRGGDRVYLEWLTNSFGKAEKFFAVAGVDGNVEGFLLHSYTVNACLIELLAVSRAAFGLGIGTALFRAVESEAYVRGAEKIQVGTQLRNQRAVNFYHKVGCRQVGCHQIYHHWS